MEHDFERQLDRHSWRLDALDEWRKETDKRVAILESEVLTEKSARLLQEALARQVLYGGDLPNVEALLRQNLRGGDVAIIMGSGTIYTITKHLLHEA